MDEKSKIISPLTDSLALLGHATYELSLLSCPKQFKNIKRAQQNR